MFNSFKMNIYSTVNQGLAILLVIHFAPISYPKAISILPKHTKIASSRIYKPVSTKHITKLT